MELQGIKGLWSLRPSTDDPHDSFLVVSFISETRILAMNMDDELEETEIEGFYAHSQTLFCQNAVYDQFIQVSFFSFLSAHIHVYDFSFSFFILFLERYTPPFKQFTTSL